MRFSRFLPILGAVFSAACALRPGLPRVTGTTDHFSLTIDASKSDLLPQLAALAESCWARQSRFFSYQPPGRIQVVFLDEQDYANGYAYAPLSWVVIHLHAAEFALRGRTRWLPNVMAHEIGHIFTLRKLGEDSRFLGWGAFHAWRGSGTSRFAEELRWEYGRVPPWLAEGLAQYAAGACGYDTLDNRRRMELQVAAASGQLLTPAELKGYAWDARRNEMIYAQGFALVNWLYSTYGSAAINRYMDAARRSGWRGAFKKTFGKSLPDLYGEWRKGLEARSHYDTAGDGAYVLPEPAGPYTMEAFPAPLGDGRFLYLSSRDNDQGSLDLFLGEAEGGARKLFRGVTSLSLDAAGGKAYFTATRFAFRQAGQISDLYAYDAKSGNIDRLTSGGRMVRGCVSEGQVYGLRNHLGRTSIVRIGEGGWTTAYAPPDSFEITDLAPGPQAGTLTLGTASGFGNDLRELDLRTQELTALAASPQDEVDPHWSGDTLYFAADYAGSYDIYAQADGNLVRLTHADGGAFHPYPARDGLWISAYGPTGFRLARARTPAQLPPFMVELPTLGWPAPGHLEYEPDTYDHSRLSFLGYDVAFGVERKPGFRQVFTDSAGDGTHVVSAAAGSRALAIAGLFFENPNGVMDAQAHFGLSQPIGYRGVTHLDATDLEIRIRALLPEIVAGASYLAYDYPDLAFDGEKTVRWDAELNGYLGVELRLAEHWKGWGQALAAKGYGYDEESVLSDADVHFGGLGGLDYVDVQAGKDGPVKGFTAFLQGGKPPHIYRQAPDWSVDAGATLYASLARRVYLQGSLYHTEEITASAQRWLYGRGGLHVALPLGLQLGTRGGAGLYLDRLYPTVEYREMGRFAEAKGEGPAAWAEAPRGLAPRLAGFGALIDREISHELAVGVSLSTLAFSGQAAFWSAMLRYDVQDLRRNPAWSVSISL